MVFIPRRTRYRDKKPISPVDINWNNSIANGLIYSCHDFKVELVAGYAIHPSTLSGETNPVYRYDLLEHLDINNQTLIEPNVGDGRLPGKEITVLIGYEKTDNTNRSSIAFSQLNLGETRCMAHFPWSDGNVYFDFGGASEGTSRLSVAGQTFESAHWVFQSSNPRSEMRIYKNGVSIASNNGGIDRGAGGYLCLGSNGLTTGDLAKYHYLHIFSRYLSHAEIDEMYANPYQLWKPRRSFFLAAAGGGGGVISTNLFHDASGQLVIAASLPPGGSTITDPTTTTLADVAPWMRGLDSADAAIWHPAQYYAGGPETTGFVPSGNLMHNADLSFGIDYWVVHNVAGGGTNYSAPTLDLSGNAPAGSHSVGVSRTGTTQAASDTLDIIYTKPVNVLPSTRYEVSAYLAAANCAASIAVKFYKLVSDVETLISTSDYFTAADAAGGQDLAGWARPGGFVTTPADCQYLKFIIRGGAATAADPVFWGAKLFVGQAYPGQSELSPWAPGGNSGAFGELESLTSSHDEYVALISVSPNTDTEIITKTFTSVISANRVRRIFLSFFCEGSSYTRRVLLDIVSGGYAETKTIYNSGSRTDTRILTFMTILTIPAGYDDDITISITVRHDYESARDFEQVTLSLLEIPS
jgi:hypothetical protein